MNILKILIERYNPTIIESPKTPILAAICQAGMSDTPNISIIWIGAVMGNIDSTTQMGLFGKLIYTPNNQSGTNNIMI